MTSSTQPGFGHPGDTASDPAALFPALEDGQHHQDGGDQDHEQLHNEQRQEQDVPRLSGADLAKFALNNARAAARRGTVEPSARRKPRTGSRSTGRDPVGLGGALRGLLVDHGWQAPVAGGGVLADWPRIAPDLAPHVQAVGFDPDAGTLELRPSSSTWSTYLRLSHASVKGRVNAHTGATTVREIKILGIGNAAVPTPADSAEQVAGAAALPAPRDPSQGYLAAKAACQASRPADPLALAVRAAIARQDAAMPREPESAFAPALDERLRREAARNLASDVQRKAVQRARQERAARELPTITPAPATPTALGKTA